MVPIKDVDYVAKLARLEFDGEDKQKFANEFNNILKFVEKLSEINTGNVDISINSNKFNNALRNDEVLESLNLKDVLSNSPDSESGYFKVPKVVE